MQSEQPSSDLPPADAALTGASSGAASDPVAEAPAPAETIGEAERAYLAARRRAEELAAAGELGQAAAAFRELLISRPKDPRLRGGLAMVLEKRGDINGALGELDLALNADPEDPQLLLARGTLLSARNRYDRAEADLRRALRSDPGNPEALTQLGQLLSRAARWREAIEPLSRAVELDRERAQAHYLLGEAFNHVDDLPLALAAYETAARLQPSHWRALKGIGIVLDRMGRPMEAAAAYQRSREAQRR